MGWSGGGGVVWGFDPEIVPGRRYIHDIRDWRYDKRGGERRKIINGVSGPTYGVVEVKRTEQLMTVRVKVQDDLSLLICISTLLQHPHQSRTRRKL